jgi:NAD-dependent SIR2 family protein deacetylase
MLERVYELIRKEDIVLWVGAGFSKYAGYPMSGELAELLYNNLTSEEQKEVSPTETFSDIAQAFVDLRKTKYSLIEILRNEYVFKVPESTHYHDELAKVPHIKTIITTNFDCLLENAFERDAVVVVDDTDIPNIKEDKTTIIKIHGDFANEHRIVVTKSDYANFVQTNLSSIPIWNVVIERVLTKNIVFIGYSIEDINTVALIDKINSALGDKRKDMFFLSPSISKRKQSSLNHLRIIPIQITGEDFITGLIKSLDDNILTDVENGMVSFETYKEYLKRRGNYGVPVFSKTGSSFSQVYSIKGETKTIVSFTINDAEIAHSINDQSIINDITIPVEKIIALECRTDGLKLPISDISKIKTITLTRSPEKTFTDFIFKEEEYNISNIPTEIYKANKAIRLDFKFNAGAFSIEISISDDADILNILITYKHPKTYNRPTDEIQFFNFLYAVFSGKHFTFITQNDLKLELQALNINKDLLEKIERNLNYFSNLRIIESHYKVIFNNILRITDTDEHNVSLIANFIKGNLIDNTKEVAMKLTLTKQPKPKGTMIIKDDILEVFYDEGEEVLIHGIKLALGKRRIVIHNPEYLNYEETMKKIKRAKNNEEIELIFNCKPNSVAITYEQNESETSAKKNEGKLL